MLRLKEIYSNISQDKERLAAENRQLKLLLSQNGMSMTGALPQWKQPPRRVKHPKRWRLFRQRGRQRESWKRTELAHQRAHASAPVCGRDGRAYGRRPDGVAAQW